MQSAHVILSFLLLSSVAHNHAAEYFISPSGNDQASGSKKAPLASVARGLEKLRGEKGGPHTLWLEDGVHVVRSTLGFEAKDENITVKAVHAGKARLDASTRVPSEALVISDNPRLDLAARGKVVVIDLAKLGVKHTKPFPERFNDGGGVVQLFAGEE